MKKLLVCLAFFLSCGSAVSSEPADAVVVSACWNPAKVVRVLDGDTFEFIVELGWEVSVRSKGRLIGIDTPEVTGADKAFGFAARDFSVVYLKTCGEFVEIKNEGKEKYGRWLVDARCPGAKDTLVAALKRAGHVKGVAGRVDASVVK